MKTSYTAWILFPALFFHSCTDSDDSIHATVKDITESVYSSVTIQPDSLYQVYSSIGGILEQSLVTEGDTVDPSKVLFRVKNTVPELNLQNARTALNTARQNAGSNSALINGIRKELANARLKRQNDSIYFHRQKKLWEQGIGSKSELDNRELSFLMSQQTHNQIIEKLRQTKLDLQSVLEQAEVNYLTASSNTGDYTIKSEINGMVYDVFKNEGEIISAQQPIASVGSYQKFVLEMLIAESDIVKVKQGQEILVSLDAYPGKLFKAKVSKIYPRKDERTQTFKVEGVFTESPEKLYPGLSGEVNIVIQTKENALVIPRKFINALNEVKTDTGMVKVTVGMQNVEYAEILKGIDSSTAILPL